MTICLGLKVMDKVVLMVVAADYTTRDSTSGLYPDGLDPIIMCSPAMNEAS